MAGFEISKIDMSQGESAEKEAFRATLQSAIHDLCAADDRLPTISLECFGSFKSGFATAGSDMDLVIVLQDGTPYTACFSLLEDDLPRALEKHLLNKGFGARLLTRTRVPIIKICEKPDNCLLDKLRAERYRWETLPNEKKYPHLHQNEHDEALAAEEADAEPTPVDTGPAAESSLVQSGTNLDQPAQSGSTMAERECTGKAAVAETPGSVSTETVTNDTAQKPQQRKRDIRLFTRERKAGPLDFPKDGVGVQCDINFFNPLGLHNTQLLRCYSLCDPRVRPMVLFVKAWAKRRKINSSYSGTLSSYGYVLMVLHYLVNVAQPPVLPNLQMPWRPNPHCTPEGATRTEVDGHVVDFWRNENEIMQAAQNRQMSSNRESVGALLSDFFRYFSSQGGYPQFHWMQDVLSLRTPGGLLRKEEKGWVKAITEDGEGKKVQHRYLFCIEDPFETSHNVARTVTHQGIVAIRDEFRRAYRILRAVG
ncbi:PAP/OAS1 substrate-binding domain-containing protein, partial [Teratosphaeria nubilosa]